MIGIDFASLIATVPRAVLTSSRPAAVFRLRSSHLLLADLLLPCKRSIGEFDEEIVARA
jgi:hypothetical protein